MCQYWRWHRSLFGVFFVSPAAGAMFNWVSASSQDYMSKRRGQWTDREREGSHSREEGSQFEFAAEKTAMPLGFVVFWRYFHSFPFLLLLHHHYSEVSNLQQEQVLWPVNRISILQLLLLPPLLFTLIVQAAAADAVWCFHYRSEMVVLLFSLLLFSAVDYWQLTAV